MSKIGIKVVRAGPARVLLPPQNMHTVLISEQKRIEKKNLGACSEATNAY